MNFLKDETQYFCENEKKESQKRSFIAMKVISLHTYFHQYINGFAFCGEKSIFFKSYQSFIQSMVPYFDSDQDLLDYYINFSKISLLSFCFMGKFQYRIFLLKKLISLKFGELSFLSIHPSHSEIIYHVFLILISSVISHRGPLHFFKNEEIEEEDQEEEEDQDGEGETDDERAEANDIKKSIEEVKSFINIDDPSQNQKLINYIKSQLSFFSSKISDFKKFEIEIIARSTTDNGLLSITNDETNILSSIFKDRIDFELINAESIKRPFSQNLLEIIKESHLFNQIIIQLNEIIERNNIIFQDENLLYVANPQFLIIDTLLLKLGRTEKSSNCKHKSGDDNNDLETCTKHHEFVAVDWNELIPKLTSSHRCPYCVLNDEPSKLSLTTSYNNTVRMTYDFNKLNDDFKSDFRSIMYLNIYNAIEEDDLHPIELHLLRMIMIIAERRLIFKENADSINKEAQHQVLVCIASIASLLFPYTSFNISATSTMYFIQNVLDKIKLLMSSHYSINKNSDQKPTYREVRKLFASSISPFMKGIFESLRKTVLSFNTKNENSSFKATIQTTLKQQEKSTPEESSSSSKKKKKSSSKTEINDENYRLNSPLKPMGSKFFLRQFLLDPNLRKKCPVIYSYLRLNDRFDRTRFISKLVPSLKLILNYAYHPHAKKFIDKEISTISDIDEDFLKNWRDAAAEIEKDLLTKEARDCLNETLVENPKISAFLPRKHENWPVMTVLLSLSDAQNKFIKTLSKYTNVVIKDIDDLEITDKRDNYRVKNTVLNIPLMNCIKGHFTIDETGFHCKFEEKHEKSFRNQLSEYTYYYIVHKSLSLRATFNYNGEGIVAQYKHIVKSRPMSHQQLIYMNKLKKNGKGTGLSLLLENLMFRLIGTSTGSSSAEGSKSIVEEIQEMMLNDKNTSSCYQLTSIENDAFFEFVNAKNYMTEKLTIDQIPSVYEYLNSLQDDALILELSIGAQLSKSFKKSINSSESYISSKMDKIDNMSKNEWMDVANVIVLIMANVNEKDPNHHQLSSLIIKNEYAEIKKVFQLSKNQNHTIKKVDAILKLDATHLSLIYEYCIQKSI